MIRFSPLAKGMLLGLAFTLVLNAFSLRTWFEHRLTVVDLGAEIGSADEVYYFALIRDVRDGHLNLGNASLFEYRNAPAVAGFALLPQGLLARFTTLELSTVILIGDLLYPLLICCLAFFILRRFLHSDQLSALLALGFMAWWSTGWLRSMSPQVTMTFFLLSLFSFVADPEGKKIYQRAVCLFLLLLIQPIYAAYILAIEGIDTLLLWKKYRSFKKVFLQRWPLVAYVLAALLLQAGLQQGADPELLAETYRRRGLILSHLPTAPLTQLFIVALLAFFLWMIRRRQRDDTALHTLPVLLIAGLVVLNQSLIHGHDVVFGLYYRLPLSFVLWLSVAWAVHQIVPRRLAIFLSILVLAFTGFHMFRLMTMITVPAAFVYADEFRNSDLRIVMEELSNNPTPEIILAPIEISNLIPVLTPHYALFTQYAHFEYASDRTLAERYLLLRSFFPLPSFQTVEGDPLVFGIYAGNVYARTKTACRLHLTKTGCEKKLSDFIYDQSVRAFVDAGNIDSLALLRRFGITTVVTDAPLPILLQPFCTLPTPAGHYKIFHCTFKTEAISGNGFSAS